MGDWPIIFDGSKWIGSTRINITPGEDDVKTAYVEVFASTIAQSNALWFQSVSGYSGNYLVDIAVGGAGSEQVIVENIYWGCSGSRNNGGGLYIPVTIPQGSRISLRCQQHKAVNWGGQFAVSYLVGGFMQGFSSVSTYGANTADSGGVSVDPGTSADTKGSWVEVTSSCNEVKALALCVGGADDTSRSSCYWYFDIGVGGAGSEVVVVSDISVGLGANVDAPLPNMWGFWPIAIPSGTRIAVRAACSITTASDRLLDVVLYGIR